MLTTISAQFRSMYTHTYVLHAAPLMNRKDKTICFLESEVGGNVEGLDRENQVWPFQQPGG